MATLKDVANLAAVSTSTVSRILHGGTIRVSNETRDRVLQAAEILNYRANSMARGLRTRVTKTIGFILPDIQNPVYSQMIAGAELAAQERGYSLLLMNSSTEERRKAFINLLAEDRVDGLVIADATLDDVWIERLRDAGRSFVLVNRRTRADAPFVVLDDQAGAATAARHLIDLGHRNMAYLAGPLKYETALQRLEGVRGEMQSAGLTLSDKATFECGFDGEGVGAAIDAILALRPKITAIPTGSIVIAFAALKALLQRGVRVPQEISLIGYHDTAFAELTTPGLTTVRMPLEELGRQAMLKIFDQVAGNEIESAVIREPRPVLVLRQSTATPEANSR